jgi:hypothetical protein
MQILRNNKKSKFRLIFSFRMCIVLLPLLIETPVPSKRFTLLTKKICLMVVLCTGVSGMPIAQTPLRMRISCLLLGHDVVHPGLPGAIGVVGICDCGEAILANAITRIRHVVACFLAGHNYVHVVSREQHEEYRCVPCGHPLLFPTEANPYAAKNKFRKKVRYLCNLFGHEVHHVTERNSIHEYACHCGHTFLKREPGVKRINHPLICLFAGHFVRQISYRNDLAELLCRNCGHTFLLEYNGK